MMPSSYRIWIPSNSVNMTLDKMWYYNGETERPEGTRAGGPECPRAEVDPS